MFVKRSEIEVQVDQKLRNQAWMMKNRVRIVQNRPELARTSLREKKIGLNRV